VSSDLTEPIYTVRHVAALCHCTTRLARGLVRRDGFPPNLGLDRRQYLFDADAVHQWWRAQRGELRPRGQPVPRVNSATLPAAELATKPYSRRARRAPAA
jgi:hypothetical protein